MANVEGESSHKLRGGKPRSILLRAAAPVLVLLGVVLCVSAAGLAVYNNVSFMSEVEFAGRTDEAIARAEDWLAKHRNDILQVGNTALLRMLVECRDLKTEPSIEDITSTYMRGRYYPPCWKGMMDPNWPVDEFDLNETIAKQKNPDYKWLLYSIAPAKAHVTPAEMGLFEPERWHMRRLTHQLYAIILLSHVKGNSREMDGLIERLCERISDEAFLSVPIVDLYIQRTTLILMAGHPEKVRQRWVERIINNQDDDGGWNDMWYCFTSADRSRWPFFRHEPSNQHATIQALTTLYLVRYRYSEHFGMAQSSLLHEQPGEPPDKE